MIQSPALSPASQEIIEQVLALAREKFSARASRYDEESAFPLENYEDLRRAGLLALTVPREYGGLGVDAVTYSLCILEMAKGCPATALTFNMHANVVGAFLEGLATPQQKERYFGEVVGQGKLFASITSEPESSFRDRFVLRTSFVPVEQGYRIQGTKHFCSLGDAADYYFVSGLLEGTTSAQEGLVSAMIPRGQSGIEVESRWNASGMRGTISHTIRYDAIVQSSEIIGEPGQLLTVGLSGFALGYAATYLGVAEAALEYITRYAASRVVPPAADPLSHHPLTQRTLGKMTTSVKAARLLLLDAAQAIESGDREAAALAVNQAKYFAAEVGVSVTEKAMRLAGGSGILKTHPLERWHRDAMAGPVMPPANDRCLETIGRIVCGLRAATLEFQ